MVKVRLVLDHQSEDKMQTLCTTDSTLWQQTENNTLSTDTGFERTLQATLCMDSVKSDAPMRKEKSLPQGQGRRHH